MHNKLPSLSVYRLIVSLSFPTPILSEPMKELTGFAVGLLLIAALFFARSQFLGASAPSEEDSKSPARFASFDPQKIDPSTTSIFIDKSEYRLYLLKGSDTLKWYPVVFGFNPTDDKMKEGDGATPEGIFKLRSIYEHDKWERFLWIDYPTEESYQRFNKRKKEGKIPQSASIGGEIGIHGVPEGYDHAIAEKQNWTLGCISMTNDDVIELFASVTEGTQVYIQK